MSNADRVREGFARSAAATTRPRRWAQLALLRDGQIIRVEPFASREEALAAAGRP